MDEKKFKMGIDISNVEDYVNACEICHDPGQGIELE